jgi:hypothetical protein
VTATPPDSLRDRIAQAIIADLKKAIPPLEIYPGGVQLGGLRRTEFDVADAVLAVVQPELDRIPLLEERVSRLTAVLDSADDLPARIARQALAEEDRLRASLDQARAAAFREAARLLEDAGRDDDAVNLLDNVADGIASYGPSAAMDPIVVRWDRTVIHPNPNDPGESRCPFEYCDHQPGDLLAQHLTERHSREGLAHKLAAAIEIIRQLTAR